MKNLQYAYPINNVFLLVSLCEYVYVCTNTIQPFFSKVGGGGFLQLQG